MHPHTTELVKNLLLPSCFDLQSVVTSKSGSHPIDCIDIIDGGDYDQSGALVNRLRNATKQNKLRFLVLSKIEIDRSVIDALMDLLHSAPSHWEALYLEFCEGTLDIAIESLLAFDNIKKLEIAGNINADSMNSLSRGLKAGKVLQELSLVMTFDDQSVKAFISGLRANTGVRRLNLIKSTLKKDGIDAFSVYLASRCKLEALNLDRCIVSKIDLTTLITSLRNLSTLKELSIAGANFNDETRMALCNLMKQHRLQKLSLHGIPSNGAHFGVNDILVGPALSDNHSLRILDLSGNDLDNKNLQFLTEILSTDATLEEVRLLENCISNEGASLLGSTLAEAKGLKRIFLHRNLFDEVGANAILEGVRSNHRIQEVTIPTVEGDNSKMSRIRVLINYETCLNAGGKQILQNRNVPLQLWPQVFERAGNILFSPYCASQMKSLSRWKQIQQMDIIFYLLRNSDIGRSKDSHR